MRNNKRIVYVKKDGQNTSAHILYNNSSHKGGSDSNSKNKIVDPLIYDPLYPAFTLSEVRPEGWLFQQLNNMRNGSSGHLDELYDKIKNDNGWLGGEGDNWEETPYWLDGATPLAYLLDDTVLQKKVYKYIEWVITHQRPSGYFGPITNAEKKNISIIAENCEAGEDWWPKMVMLKVLQQYYSATNDERVISLMKAYFNYQLSSIKKCKIGKWTGWSEARGVENLMLIQWLYGITQESYLFELAELISVQSYSWSKWFEERNMLMNAALHVDDKNVMQRHSVNVAMGLKDPAIQYLRLRDKKLLETQLQAWHDLMTLHGLPNGIFSGDEDLHGSQLTQGTELCTIVESMFSLEKIIEITGDIKYMDALERMTFNVLPAQTTDDYQYKQYFQIPNQVHVTRGAFNFSVTQYNGMSNVFGTKSGYTCCYTNMHQGWTKFASHLWHKTPENGIATFMYAPSSVNIKIKEEQVRIKEITEYPFDDRVTFVLSAVNELSFPWTFRIPSWCNEAEIHINGEVVKKEKGGQLVTIERKWKNNDTILLHMPMNITVSRWASNSRTIERGPLVYALKIEEKWKKGLHPEAGEYYSVYPKSDWNYGLLEKQIKDSSLFIINKKRTPDKFGWSLENAPYEITAAAKKLPDWKLDREILYQPVGDRSGLYRGRVNKKIQSITLVPYGFTKLRIVAFTVVE